jgi:hypothetical protein
MAQVPETGRERDWVRAQASDSGRVPETEQVQGSAQGQEKAPDWAPERDLVPGQDLVQD